MDRSAASSGNVVRLGWPFSLFRLVIYNWSNIVLNVLGEVKSGFLFCCERLSKPTGKGGQKHVERGTHPQNVSTSSRCGDEPVQDLPARRALLCSFPNQFYFSSPRWKT
jgi:hypothetical protein